MRPLQHNSLFLAAQARWDEARARYDAGQFSGAVYLAGYTLELTLKAQIAENMGIFNFFQPGQHPAEWTQAFKIHDLDRLLFYSGRRVEFLDLQLSNPKLSEAWSFASTWNEQWRYDKHTITQQEAFDEIHIYLMETPSADLILQLKRLRASIESEGKHFEVFGLDPFVPHKKDTDYVLTVKGEWLPVPGSTGLKHLIHRYQQLIAPESRKQISRIRPLAHYEAPPATLIPVG